MRDLHATRTILESDSNHIPRDIPNGVYPVNPAAAQYANGYRFAVLHNSASGGSLQLTKTRDEAEAKLAKVVAFHLALA